MKDALEPFNAVAQTQGWLPSTIARVALGFIDRLSLSAALARYAQQQADYENSHPGAEPPTTPALFEHLDDAGRQVVRSALRNYAASCGHMGLGRAARGLLRADRAAGAEAHGDDLPAGGVLAELLVDVAGAGRRGTGGIVFERPAHLTGPDDACIFISEAGQALVDQSKFAVVARWSPYDSLNEAERARAAGLFGLTPSKPERIIADVIEQLDAIGIPDWAGAEGLCLEAARAFLAGGAPEQLREARQWQTQLDSIGWDDPQFPFSDWQAEVANGDTRRSFAQWVMYKREEAEDAPEAHEGVAG